MRLGTDGSKNETIVKEISIKRTIYFAPMLFALLRVISGFYSVALEWSMSW